MRRFDNEDIILSGEASRNLLNTLFLHNSSPIECVEFENVSSEDTLNGALYHFPGLEINLNDLEEESLIITDETRVAKSNIHYQTVISVTHSVRLPSFVNYGYAIDKQSYHSNAESKSYTQIKLVNALAQAA